LQKHKVSSKYITLIKDMQLKICQPKRASISSQIVYRCFATCTLVVGSGFALRSGVIPDALTTHLK
jgi:hypothetical protein